MVFHSSIVCLSVEGAPVSGQCSNKCTIYGFQVIQIFVGLVDFFPKFRALFLQSEQTLIKHQRRWPQIDVNPGDVLLDLI